ncbi:MAG: hypothetical protein HXY30_17345 [Pseudorhodoplanes sp.]|nr:hypothetical protein [Pseudorhodoplanes sp.]
MSPDMLFWLALFIKMVVAACFVVGATVTAERVGPVIGALIATLPVSAGPAYVFLALDHDPAFIARSALSSLALNGATAIYAATYVLLAQRHGFAVSVPLAFLAWLASVPVFVWLGPTTASAILLNLAVFPIAYLVVRRFRNVPMPSNPLRWYDFAVRAALVAALVGAVVGLSFRIGPAATGVLAAFPVVFTSIMFILHFRVGGPAAAAVLANAILGLAGFGMAVLTLHLLAEPLGSALALISALAVAVAWNLGLFTLRRAGIAA